MYSGQEKGLALSADEFRLYIYFASHIRYTISLSHSTRTLKERKGWLEPKVIEARCRVLPIGMSVEKHERPHVTGQVPIVCS